MADIPLRTYVEQIDGLVDKKQIDEAIAHCKHILTYYPKHLGTYQALGKALLEKGRHADAADIFNRVLAAVPEDYVSHIGMSIVCEDQGNVDGALWHMERAFEVMPSNPAIQDELRRLYGRRDGLMPPRTRLTRGALARMYVKGGLFAQAEAELKKALANAPDRLDLATLLAQVYWQTNRRQEAADICSNLLDKLPYNQDANRMLADILLTQGRTAELVPYRQRLEALDPYAAFAEPNTDGHGPTPKPETVLVPKLDYTPDMAATAAGTPDWVASIGATLEEPSRAKTVPVPDWLPQTAPTEGEVAQAAELPDWLQGAQVAVGSAPGKAPAEAAPLPSAEGDMPDWMKSAVTTPLDMPDWMKGPPPAEATPAAAPTAEESAEWMASATTTSEVPDWMKDMAPSAEAAAPGSQPAALAFAAPAAEPTAEAPAGVNETPDWLKAAGAAPAEELPDWLKEAAPAAAAVAPMPPAAPPATPDVGGLSEEDALRWLEGLALQQGANPEEMVSQPLAAVAPEAAALVAEPADAVPAEELPEWLKPAETAPAEELPAWLQDMVPSAEAAAPGAQPAVEVPAAPAAEPAAAAPAEEIPDWLKSAEAAPDQGLPDWLQTPSAAASPTAEAAEIPDWLRAVEAASPVAGLPDWLEKPTPAPAEQEAVPLAAAEVPDWLKEQIPPAAKEEASPPAAAEVPAWPPAETPVVPAPAAAAEKPDWLKAIEEESDAYEASLAQTPALVAPEPAKPKLRPEELPDFLQMASPEAVERAEQPTHLAEEMAPEAPLEPKEPPLAAAEIPDWFKDFAPAAAEPAPEPTEPIQWLESAPAAPTVAPAEPAEPIEPAAEIPEWVQRPVEKTEAPMADLPNWVQELPPGPTDTVALWLAKQKIPEWLRQPEEEAKEQPPAEWLHAPVEEAAKEPTAAAPGPATPPQAPTKAADERAPGVPGPTAVPTEEVPAVVEPAAVISEVSEEDALRWLENLAQQQGAEAEELITQPEEGLAQPPARMAAEVEAAPRAEAQAATEAEPAPEAPAVPPQGPDETIRRPTTIEEQVTKPLDQLPSWLTLDILEPTPTEPPTPAPAQVAEEPAVPSAPAAPPEPAAMGEEDALRWLETLAAQQGARPEELITKPEERLAQPPAWVAAEAQPEPEARPLAEQPQPPTAAVETPAKRPAGVGELGTRPLEPMPAWLHLETPEAPAPSEPAKPVEPPAPAAPAEPAAMGEDEALRWLESLAAQQGARPEELITKPEERLAQPPAWVAAELQAAPAAEAQAAPAAEAQAAPPAQAQAAPPAEVPAIPEAAELAAAEAPPPEAPAAPAEPAAMGADEALRWLESLAAQHGARPEELITKPEERLALPPAWVAAEAQAATAAEMQAAPAAEAQAAEAPEAQAIPEAEAEAPAAAEVTVEAPAPLEVAVPASPTELAAMSEDEALRWLESLAVQQGARPEELITKPEERLAQPPSWVAAEAQAPTGAAVEPSAVPELPAPAAVTEFPAPLEPGAMSDDEALRWLESLAVQQGARPEELITKPEERRAQPPSWVTAEVQAATEAEPQAAEAPGVTPEAPIEPKPQGVTAPPEAGLADAERAKDARLSKLAEKLAAGRRAKEAEIEARFDTQRAEQEAARRAVQEKLTRRPAGAEAAPEAATRPLAPTEAAPAAAEPMPTATKPAVRAARAPTPARPQAAAPKPKKVKLSKSPYAAEAPETVLTLARQHLAEGNHDQAADPLAYLVASNQMLQPTINELEAYTARQYSAPLLQILGDAYMKTNQLQKALETYRQALGHL